MRRADEERAEPHDREERKQRQRDRATSHGRSVMVCALQGEQHRHGEQQSVQSDGADPREEPRVSYHSVPLVRSPDRAGDEACREWNAEEHEHDPRDLPDAHVEVGLCVEAEPDREHLK